MRVRRWGTAALLSSMVLVAGPVVALPASADVGASALEVTTNYVLAAPGETFTVAGTAADGVGVTVTVAQNMPDSSRLPLGTAVVQPDGSWSAEIVMPEGADSLVLLYATAPRTDPGGRVEDSLRAVRSAGSGQAVVAAPVGSTITGGDEVIPVEVVLHDPAAMPNGWFGTVVQGGTFAADEVGQPVWSGLDSPEPSLSLDLDLATVSNGPALLVVSFYLDGAPVAVAVKEIVVDLDGGLADVRIETRQFSDGEPYLKMYADVRAIGPGAAVNWRIDDGEDIAATVPLKIDPEQFRSSAAIFSPAVGGSGLPLGPQIVADGPHVGHVSVTNRGTTTVYDVPFVVDTTPHLTLDAVELDWTDNPTTGPQYRVAVRGHARGIWTKGATLEVVGPDGVLVMEQTPPFAGGGTLPDASTWGFGLKVAYWSPYDQVLRVRVRVHDLDGSARCIELVRRGTLPLEAACGATVPGTTTASPTTWTASGLPFDVAWADGGGSPVSLVDTVVEQIPGVPGPTPYTSVNLVSSPSAGVAPVPAAGTAYRVSFGVENSLGAGAVTPWGVIQASGVTATSRTVKDGMSTTAGGTVVATVPTLSIPAVLPAGSASVVCRSRSTGAVVLDAVRTPAPTTRTFGAAITPRSNLTCRAEFLGDAAHGVAPSSRSFAVFVAPVLTATLADRSIRTGTTTRLNARVSAVGRAEVVRLQRWYAGSWHDVQRTRPSATGRAAFDVRAWVAGTNRFRVVQSATSAHAAGASASVALTGF